MENVLIILTAIFCLAVVATITVYNYFDRINFRIERLIRRHSEALDGWAKKCDTLLSGSADAYFKAKQARAKLKCFCRMIYDVRTGSGEIPEITSQLQDFCSAYNVLAEEYNRKLNLPVIGQIARISRQSPWERLNFYPE